MRMPPSGRPSILLLLVLAAGLAAAFASAVSAHEMMCCAEGMDAETPGCAWLGAGDCCTEAPVAPASSSPTPPTPAACGALPLPVVGTAPAAISSCALLPPSAHAALRTTILRL